jgi:hypothetical protein
MSTAGTLELLARELGQALAPLADQLAPDQADEFLAELGLRLPPGLSAESALSAALSSAATAAGALPPLVTQLATAIAADDAAQIVAAGLPLLGKAGDVIQALKAIGTQLDSAAAGFPGLSPAEQAVITGFAATLGRRMLDAAIIARLEDEGGPNIAPSLALVGLFDLTPEPGVDGDRLQPAYVRRTLHLERLGNLLTDPVEYARDLYHWGDPGFDGLALFTALQRLLDEQLRLPADLLLPPGQPPVLEAYTVRLTTNPATNPPGLLADIRFPATRDFEESFTLRGPWKLSVSAKARFDADAQLELAPSGSVALRPKSGTAQGEVQAGLVADRGGDPIVILGQTEGTRLEAKHIGLSLGISATWNGTAAEAEPLASAEVLGGHLMIDLSNSDGFIHSILGASKVESNFELKARWQPSTGMVFEGGAGIELVIPTHINLGPVEIQTLYFRLDVSAAVPVRLEVSAGLTATLGPFTLTVDRIGAAGLFTFPANGDGNLGPADLTFDFRPPTGLGVLVRAGPVAGGGFLSFDPANGRYAGILQLEAATIAITAIGLLDTRLPGGTSGFSFLIIVSVEFQPIQLGFGFTLNGVGGLGGINRTVATEVLRQGIRAGSLNHIMFPQDPIRNAPQIISDIRAIFPPAQGRYLFGPMLKLGWGVPSLVTASLGIVLELPDPVRLIILGQFKVAMPADDVALIKLNLDILGIIDFGAKLLSIDGSLYDSYVTVYSVYGDMALRMFWGQPPNFALSVGGLHPQFRPPPDFPVLRRLTLELGLNGNPRLTCQSYWAITSNSAQFGASVELYASAAGFNIHGWLGFDALIIFRPFSFLVDISAGVELRRGSSVIAGIHLDGHLSGPAPWHAWGKACLSLFFFDICVPVSLTIGSEESEPAPQIDAWAELEKALKDSRNWESGLPAANLRALSYAPPEGAAVTLIDPLGSLTVHEKVAPLNRKLEKIGEAVPSGVNEFDVSGVTIGGSTTGYTLVQDFFAAGQYQALTDAEKLSRDSYELMDSGVGVATGAVEGGATRGVPVNYEAIVLDAPEGPQLPFSLFASRAAGLYSVSGTSLTAMSQLAFGAHLAATGRPFAVEATKPPRVAFEDEGYVVASATDLTRLDGSAPSTKGAAYAALKQHLAANPGEQGRWQVVPLHELAVSG